MIKVVVIGSGNVAQHLIKAFQKAENIALLQVFARKKSNMDAIVDDKAITTDYDELLDADVYILAVTDNAIASVATSLPFHNKLVVHTSGSAPLDVLNSKNRKGVFYPLQTFSKSKKVNFKEIPFCLETENSSDYALLERLAHSISTKTYAIDSNQRKALHVAAVLVNNFVNHMYVLSNDICKKYNIPFEIMLPLIKETADKVTVLEPFEAQTGPAKRNDTTTINAHLQFLEDQHIKEIYKIITKSIIDHDKKL